MAESEENDDWEQHGILPEWLKHDQPNFIIYVHVSDLSQVRNLRR